MSRVNVCVTPALSARLTAKSISIISLMTYLALARDPDIRFVFSNTTEAGISYVEGDRLEMRHRPASRPN